MRQAKTKYNVVQITHDWSTKAIAIKNKTLKFINAKWPERHKKTRKQEQVTKSHDMTIGCKHREIKPENTGMLDFSCILQPNPSQD